MVNASLRDRPIPATQKPAVDRYSAIEEAAGLDAGELKNYRSVSEPTVVSKLVKRAVESQLTDYRPDAAVCATTVPRQHRAFLVCSSTQKLQL